MTGSQRRPCRRAAILAGLLLAPLVISPAAPSVGATGSGQTQLVSGAEPPNVLDPAASSPALSASGALATYVIDAPETETRRVLVRALTGGDEVAVSPAALDATAPSIDAAGDRVAYVAARERRQSHGNVSNAAVFVSSVQDGQRVTRRVSGSGDPWDARVPDCSPALEIEDPVEAGRCGPVLSGDGRTIVYPVELPAAESSRLLRGLRVPGARVVLNAADEILGTFSFGAAAEVRTSTVGSVIDTVLVLRRDANGDGDFIGEQDPPARIVSLDADGEVIDGAEPSLSHNGRYVAFASTRNRLLGVSRVLVHDTGPPGGSNGGTREVPVSTLLPVLGVLDWAAQPSLSADGRRVAFTRAQLLEVSAEVALQLPASRLRPPVEGRVEVLLFSTQVEVYDLDLRRVVVASSTPDGSLGWGWSHSPALARDGSTVAFASDAPNLLPQGADGAGPAVYARDLAPDLGGGGTPGPEVVSLPADGSLGIAVAGMPALDADAGVVAFVAAARLTSDARATTHQVYARHRFPSPRLHPVQLDFEKQQVGVPGLSRPVTVTNDGPGPTRVSTRVEGPFVTGTGCAAVTLHRGESCTIDVSFAPTTLGPHTGVLRAALAADGLPVRELTVALRGNAVPTVFRLRPLGLTFPRTGIGRRTSLEVRVRNVTTRPLTVVPTILPAQADYSPRAAASCRSLAPGATCTVTVRFSPRRLGKQAGTLRVIASTAGTTVALQDLALSGATLTPSVSYSPTVAYLGRVTFVRGTGFYPRQIVVLQWGGGIVTSPLALTDRDGTFTVPVIFDSGSGAGLRALTLSQPPRTLAEQVINVTAPPLPVVVGSAQPPNFVNRD